MAFKLQVRICSMVSGSISELAGCSLMHAVPLSDLQVCEIRPLHSMREPDSTDFEVRERRCMHVWAASRALPANN